MAEKDPRVIGARIAKARQARDMTQAELAAALAVAESTVANWERGIAYPKRKLGKIEEYFGHRLDYDGDADTYRPSVNSDEAVDRAIDEINAVLDALRRSRGKESNGDEEPNGGKRASLSA